MGLLVIIMGVGPFMIWKQGLMPKSKQIWMIGIGITGLTIFILSKQAPFYLSQPLAGISTVTWLGTTILCDMVIRFAH